MVASEVRGLVTACPVPSRQLKAICEGQAPRLQGTQKQHSQQLFPALNETRVRTLKNENPVDKYFVDCL